MLHPCDDPYWPWKQMRAPSTGTMVDATATMPLRATTGRMSFVDNKREPAVVNMRLVDVDVR
jgi:hypothetical protein